MNINALLARTGDQIGIHRVFGEPIERGEVTVVPVAVVMGGGGGGIGPFDQDSGMTGPDSGMTGPDSSETGPDVGAGAGFGVWARAIGVYEIRDGRVRFVPAFDVVALGVLGLLLTRIVFGAVRRAGRRRS